MRCRSLIWVEVGECRQKESSAACVTVEYQTFTRGFNSSQRSYRHLRAGLSYNHQPNIIWEENTTHILPLIRCYASQTHHSRWECAMQQFGVSCFYAVKISHDSYYFCSSHVALYHTLWHFGVGHPLSNALGEIFDIFFAAVLTATVTEALSFFQLLMLDRARDASWHDITGFLLYSP